MEQDSTYKTNQNEIPIFKSDSLAELRPFFEKYVDFGIISQIFQITVIVDANVIIGDLIWLTKTRDNPNARTALQEVIASNTLTATAPQWLENEIIENIPEVAEKENIPVQKLQAAWQKYRELIQFDEEIETPSSIPDEILDSDDFAYFKMQQNTGHPIYSQDNHFKEMGAALIDDTAVIIKLRDYARYEAIELNFLFGQLVITGIGIEMIKLGWNVLKGLFKTLSNLPDWIKYSLTILFLGALLHPKTKDLIIQFFQNKNEEKSSLFSELLEKTVPIFDKIDEAQKKSDQTLSEAKSQIPTIN